MHTLEQLKSGQLTGLKRVRIRENLTEFPEELFSLSETLEELDLSENQLSHVPENIGVLKNLKAIFFFDNKFEHIPTELSDCAQLTVYGFRNNNIREINLSALPERLRWLILTGNNITQMRGDMSHLKNLQKCMLAGNQLQYLPESMRHCDALELLRISSNQLKNFPTWLLSMPRLSWLAYAGNQFNKVTPANAESIAKIHWESLVIKHELGQGASGVVYKATLPATDKIRNDVAVKVFKSSMTSDGSPLDERNANIAVGSHSNTVSVIGEIADHPEKKQGLVLDLIPANFENMSGPPSLESCTRDTYVESRQFRLPELINIATGMARFALHCHKQGVLHGDLYPHNTLVDDEGNCLVSDFGAATRFDSTDKTLAEGLQSIEVRAWACALEDMLDRLHKQDLHDNNSVVTSLTALKQSCFAENPASRPDFYRIVTHLEQL